MGDFQFFLFSFLSFPPSLSPSPSFAPEGAAGGKTWPEYVNPKACDSLPDCLTDREAKSKEKSKKYKNRERSRNEQDGVLKAVQFMAQVLF